MIINEKIKELRIENGLTQAKLAESLGLSQSTVARWEREECEPTATAIVRLAEILKCSCDYLLGKSEY